MPTYKITDPATGRVYRLTGDSAPTEQEIEEIIGSAEPSAPSQPPATPGALDRFTAGVKSDILARGRGLQENADRFLDAEPGKPANLAFSPDANPLQYAFQQAGELAGGVADVAGRAAGLGMDVAKRAVPQPVKDVLKRELAPLGQAASATLGAGMRAAQPALEAAGQYAEENPGGAENWRALGNLSAAIPIGKGAQVGGKVAIEGAKISAKPLAGPLMSTGEKIANVVLKPTARDLKDGLDTKWMLDNKLGGSLPEVRKKLDSEFKTLTTKLDAALGENPTKIDLDAVLNKTIAEVHDVKKQKGKGYGFQTNVNKAFEYLKNENAAQGEAVDIVTANNIKRSVGRLGSWEYDAKKGFNKTNMDEINALGYVANKYYKNLKEAVEVASPEGVKEINERLSKLIPIERAVERRLPVADRNEVIPLKEFGAIGAALATGGAKGVGLLGLAGLQALSKSGSAAQGMYNIGKGLERTPGVLDRLSLKNQRGGVGASAIDAPAATDIAKQLGLKFNGMQDTGFGTSAGAWFTTKKGNSFMASSLEEAVRKLKEFE